MSRFTRFAFALLILIVSPVLAVPQGNQPVFFGLPHISLGGATATQVGGELVVNNIGDSGDDGIRSVAGGMRGIAMQMPAIPASAPSGAERVFEWTFANGPPHRLHEVRQPFGVVLQMSYGPSIIQPRTIELYAQGELVARQTAHIGDWDLIVLGAQGSASTGGET